MATQKVSLRVALSEVLADIVKLRKPVTAAALVATVVELISPLGINVGNDGAKVTGALVLLGTAVALLEKYGVVKATTDK